MKLWLDDIRPAPEGWLWCKTVQEAKIYLENATMPIEISFDHDLGEDQSSGYDLACYIEYNAYTGKKFPIISWAVHSANPVGRENIKKAMESFDAA